MALRLDTHIIGELRNGGRANPGVTTFFATLAPEDIDRSVLTIGELRRGLEKRRGRGDRKQAERLEARLERVVSGYSDRILSFDLDCAQIWGKLMSPNPQHAIDKQIAAIALIDDLTVVTRHTDDFESSGVRSINPFSERASAFGCQRPRAAAEDETGIIPVFCG